MPERAALILAAGLARRMGQPKLARMWLGRPVLAWTVDRIKALVPGIPVVVVGPPSGPVRAVAEALSVTLVVNPEPEAGLGRSLAVGVEALDAAGAFIFLGDQPEVSAAGVARVLAESAAADVVLPRYRGAPGHPVYVGRPLWPRLATLRGDRGVRAVLADWPRDRVREVEIDEPAPADLDTEEDWRRWTGDGAQRG